ncbi:MAG TPA: hypothetical protein VHY20_02205, partial [Pirellulales bacterium]|nr:hypothetical protein [Pirellulales bacterium]
MKVFARFELSRGRLDPGDTALLVEGRWPAEPKASDRQQPAGRFSLDREIDSRFGWIDQCAADMAEHFAATGDNDPDPSTANGAWLNVVKLRYLLVKLLRVAAFFQSPSRAVLPAVCQLFFESGRDLCYVRLLRALARQQGFDLIEHAVGSGETAGSASLMVAPSETWRSAAQRLLRPVQPAVARGTPRIVLCGNPRLLAPVCRELIRRKLQPWWLAERFAPRGWLRWRRFGVGVLSCDGGTRSGAGCPASQFLEPAATLSASSCWTAIDLFAPAVAAWLQEVRAEFRQAQAMQAAQIGKHLDRLRPLYVLLDQDGSPFHRAVVAAARDRGVRTSIVQHGAPFIRFGFAPLVADRFCAWGDTSRDQLVRWGISRERITVTGTAQALPVRHVSRRPIPPHAPRFALLATLAPADSRPDAVNFHLTGETFAAMIRGALAAIANRSGAHVTIKLHPRDRRSPAIREIAAGFT